MLSEKREDTMVTRTPTRSLVVKIFPIHSSIHYRSAVHTGNLRTQRLLVTDPPSFYSFHYLSLTDDVSRISHRISLIVCTPSWWLVSKGAIGRSSICNWCAFFYHQVYFTLLHLPLHKIFISEETVISATRDSRDPHPPKARDSGSHGFKL